MWDVEGAGRACREVGATNAVGFEPDEVVAYVRDGCALARWGTPAEAPPERDEDGGAPCAPGGARDIASLVCVRDSEPKSKCSSGRNWSEMVVSIFRTLWDPESRPLEREALRTALGHFSMGGEDKKERVKEKVTR